MTSPYLFLIIILSYENPPQDIGFLRHPTEGLLFQITFYQSLFLRRPNSKSDILISFLIMICT
jgi:hypothetical protein